MDKAQQRRWMVLLLLLAGTLAAIFYPVEEFSQEVIAPVGSRAQVAKRAVAARHAVRADAQTAWLAMEENPFAPRGWTPPAPAPVEARQVAAVIVAEPPPAPPPPLPFRFLGQMSDGDDRVIYLGVGEQLVPARLGDVLEGRYKVSAIAATHIEFETTSSGLRQTLALPAQDR